LSAGKQSVAALIVLLLALAAPSLADVRRMEAVGAEPIRADAGLRVSLRDAALKRALRDAVVRVAFDLLAPVVAVDTIDSMNTQAAEEGLFDSLSDPLANPIVEEALDPAAEKEALENRLVVALGDDPLDYAVRFRILEDRGERPALFVDDPEVEGEYVMVVEVYVDTERVRRRLDRRGFELIPSGEATQVRIRLELFGVDRFGAYEKVRRALAGDSRVRSVVPVEMERGRAVLEVDSEHEPEALLERLYQVIPPEIEIRPIIIEEGHLSLRVKLRQEPGTVASPKGAFAAPQEAAAAPGD